MNIPLFTVVPQLRGVPRAALCTFPSPIVRAERNGVGVWIKRDDLNAESCGGNKARTLEWLLANVSPGDEVLTLGGEGSTHVLATAIHAARLGARTTAFRWKHEMNPTAERVAALASARCDRAPVYATSIEAMIRAAFHKMRHRQPRAQSSPSSPTLHHIPLGGSTPLGVLAHVNAAMELADQINAGVMPHPSRIVVPLGSGGTMAGLLLGAAIAGLELTVIGVQVTPRIVANQFNVQRLIARTAMFIERIAGIRVPRPRHDQLRIAHSVYGGAYGRLVPAGAAAARWLEETNGILLDQTYSAKAFACALAIAHAAGPLGSPTLFWNTFDGRLLRHDV